MPRPPVLGYLQSAVADNTAHSQMDKLIFENKMSNIQSEWGTYSEQQEGYDPVMEFAEGMIPVGGVLKKVNMNKVRKYLHYVKDKSLFKKGKEPDWWGSGGWGKVGGGRIYKKPLVKYNVKNYQGKRKAIKRYNPITQKEDTIKPWWEEHGDWDLLNRQQGGPAERAPLLGYMNPVFNPEGSGYDMETALDAGLTRDEIGHMGSLDPRTGMVLKGKSHESWNPMVQTEMSLGNTVEYDPDKGRYFSVEGGMYNPAIQDETAHSQMDRLMFENELEQQPQHSMRTYQQGYDPAKAISEGDFLPPVGMAKAIYKTSEPVWKYATGESLLEAMESSIKESLPKIFPKKPRKWLKEGVLKKAYEKEAWWPGKGRTKPKLSEEGRKELEKISKELHNVELNLPKIKPTDLDKIEDARGALDASLAEGISEFSRLGTMSSSRVKYIDKLSKSMKSVANKYYNRPENINEFENMQKRLFDYYEPHMPKVRAGGKYGTELKPLSQHEKWRWVTESVDKMPPPDQAQILGGFYEPYKIWNTLLGKTGNWGAARGNLKLKPDVLNPNIVPVNKRRPK